MLTRRSPDAIRGVARCTILATVWYAIALRKSGLYATSMCVIV